MAMLSLFLFVEAVWSIST